MGLITGSETATFLVGGMAVVVLSLSFFYYLASTVYWPLVWCGVIVPYALAAVLVAAQLLCNFEWRRVSAAKCLTVPGTLLGGASLAAHVAIYGLWWSQGLLSASLSEPLRHCVHNYAAISSLFNCAALSVRWHSPWPLALQVLMQPLATLDRAPLGCTSCWPQWQDHFACLYGTLAAVCVLRGPAVVVTVSTTHAAATAKHGGVGSSTVERLQQGCAFLSLFYLFICWTWTIYGHTVLLDTAYHVTWSFLRPCYVALFLVYYIKCLPQLKDLQALVCGFGFVYFFAFCGLAQTLMTARMGSRLVDGETYTNFGKAGHRCEALSFYASMLLFFVHGICGGQWAAVGKRFQTLVSSVGLLQFCVLVLSELYRIQDVVGFDMGWWKPVEELDFMWSFIMVHYGLYITICLASTYILQLRDDLPLTHEVLLSLAGPAEGKGAPNGAVGV